MSEIAKVLTENNRLKEEVSALRGKVSELKIENELIKSMCLPETSVTSSDLSDVFDFEGVC